MLLCKKCHDNCQCLSPTTPSATCLMCGTQGKVTDCSGYLPPEKGQEAIAPWMSAMANSTILGATPKVELRIWGHYVTRGYATGEAKKLIGLGQGTMKAHPVLGLKVTKTNIELDDSAGWNRWFYDRAPGVAPGHLLLVENFNEVLVLVITPTAATAANALQRMEAERNLLAKLQAEREAKERAEFERQTRALWNNLNAPALGDGSKND